MATYRKLNVLGTLLVCASFPTLAAEPVDREVAAADEAQAVIEEGGELPAPDEAADAHESEAANAPESAHATQPAPTEMVALAGREPEQFIGKTLVLDDGTDLATVGPVLTVRKRISDQELHLIVDASHYFNAPTTYAVAVRDVDRIEGNNVVTPEMEGMHLRGLDYYADDYADIEAPTQTAAALGLDLGEDVDAGQEVVTDEDVETDPDADVRPELDEEPVDPADDGVVPLNRF